MAPTPTIIESVDFFASDWIKTGIKEERLIYRHWFNERRASGCSTPRWTCRSAWGWHGAVPEDLQIRIGSQWWCLRRRTVEAMLAFLPSAAMSRGSSAHLDPGRDVLPDPGAPSGARRRNPVRTLTFLMFTDYGMPVTFYNDHFDLLLAQDYLFARKISPTRPT